MNPKKSVEPQQAPRDRKEKIGKSTWKKHLATENTEFTEEKQEVAGLTVIAHPVTAEMPKNPLHLCVLCGLI